MDNVNQTLYIPLYGKAFVSKRGIILHDEKAEQIWEAEGFPLKGKSKSKWLAYYMGMRSAVFDRWLEDKMEESSDAVVLHIGCGMDSRVIRVGVRGKLWYDVDFPEVIEQRRKYYQETAHYKMLCGDLREQEWMSKLPRGKAIVVLEGISMYLRPAELKLAFENLYDHFESVQILMDCYTEFAAKASKYKNPINDVGVTEVFGMDDPHVLPGFLREHEMTPQDLIDQLQGIEKRIFSTLYAGPVAKKMYRLYEYAGGNHDTQS
jgi:O-methyltransferase involved in polyketide biosynthesis